LQVVRELDNIKQFSPISLIGTHVVPQVKFPDSVDPLGLSITLGMKIDGEVFHKLEQLRPKYFTICLKNKWVACSIENSLGAGKKVAYLEYRSWVSHNEVHKDNFPRHFGKGQML